MKLATKLKKLEEAKAEKERYVKHLEMVLQKELEPVFRQETMKKKNRFEIEIRNLDDEIYETRQQINNNTDYNEEIERLKKRDYNSNYYKENKYEILLQRHDYYRKHRKEIAKQKREYYLRKKAERMIAKNKEN
jgi:hypothetical protein